jgi:hypothetical protein
VRALKAAAEKLLLDFLAAGRLCGRNEKKAGACNAQEKTDANFCTERNFTNQKRASSENSPLDSSGERGRIHCRTNLNANEIALVQMRSNGRAIEFQEGPRGISL